MAQGLSSSGPHTNIDIAHGALASHVAKHALAIDGPGFGLRVTFLLDDIRSTG
jgi:hypothetical protein